MYYITPEGIIYHKHFILVTYYTNMIPAVSEGGGKYSTVPSQG